MTFILSLFLCLPLECENNVVEATHDLLLLDVGGENAAYLLFGERMKSMGQGR